MAVHPRPKFFPPWIGNVFFEHFTGQGFSEVYYLTATTDTAAVTAIAQIATLRLAMMPDKNRALFWRISNGKIRGDTLVRTATGGVDGTYGITTTETMPSNVSLKTRVQCEDRRWSMRYFHCLPEDCVTDGIWTPTTAMNTAFSALRTFLMENCTGVFAPREGEPVDVAIIKAIIDLIPLSVNTRRTGRPFGLPRGRSVIRF